MTTFVALLRAVNVSGQNKIPMAELRRALGGLGLTGVETYVQSGNVVFDAQGDDPAEQAAAIHGLIEREFGYDVDVSSSRPPTWRTSPPSTRSSRAAPTRSTST